MERIIQINIGDDTIEFPYDFPADISDDEDAQYEEACNYIMSSIEINLI